MINAIAVGLFGGVAGIIGALITKAGFSWGRFLPIAGIVIALALTNDGRLAYWVRAATLTPESTGAMMKQTNPQLLGFIEANFPDDYAALTSWIADIIKAGGTEAQVGRQSAEATAEIRRKYAPMIARASDRDHAAVIELNIAFYQALLATDPLLCNAVAISGATELLNRPGMDRLKAMIEPQAVAILQAAVNGMGSPVKRRAVTDADWLEVGDAMYARGATDAQINAISALEPSSPDLCPGVIAMLQTLNSVDTVGIKAVRAQYLANIAGS